VRRVGCIEVIADDLAGVVDALGVSAIDGGRIVQCTERAVAVEKAVNSAFRIDVLADDLAAIV